MAGEVSCGPGPVAGRDRRRGVRASRTGEQDCGGGRVGTPPTLFWFLGWLAVPGEALVLRNRKLFLGAELGLGRSNESSVGSRLVNSGPLAGGEPSGPEEDGVGGVSEGGWQVLGLLSEMGREPGLVCFPGTGRLYVMGGKVVVWGKGLGNTCTPVADSCQCVGKTTAML